MSKFLTEKDDSRSIYWAENSPKSGPFKFENNAWNFSKQLHNKFEKVQNTTFSTPKKAKIRMSIWPKRPILGSIFALRALILPCWKKFQKKQVPLNIITFYKILKKKARFISKEKIGNVSMPHQPTTTTHPPNKTKCRWGGWNPKPIMQGNDSTLAMEPLEEVPKEPLLWEIMTVFDVKLWF